MSLYDDREYNLEYDVDHELDNRGMNIDCATCGASDLYWVRLHTGGWRLYEDVDKPHVCSLPKKCVVDLNDLFTNITFVPTGTRR